MLFPLGKFVNPDLQRVDKLRVGIDNPEGGFPRYSGDACDIPVMGWADHDKGAGKIGGDGGKSVGRNLPGVDISGMRADDPKGVPARGRFWKSNLPGAARDGKDPSDRTCPQLRMNASSSDQPSGRSVICNDRSKKGIEGDCIRSRVSKSSWVRPVEIPRRCSISRVRRK